MKLKLNLKKRKNKMIKIEKRYDCLEIVTCNDCDLYEVLAILRVDEIQRKKQLKTEHTDCTNKKKRAK